MPLLLWTFSFALAATLAWSLLANLGSRERARSRTGEIAERARTDLIRLRSRLSHVKLRDRGRDHLRDVAMASMQLRPPRPRVVETPGERTTAGSEEAGEPAAAGPLAADWEYAGGVFIAGDPSRSRVWLRRKQDAKTAGSRYSTRSRTRYRRTSRVVRGRSRTRVTRVDEKDLISFYAGQRRFKDEELEIEFLIRSVDWNEIVYSRPENPEKEYVLERVDNSPYVLSEEKRLEPFAAEDESEEEDEDGKHFRLRAPGYVDRVEEDYQRLLRGDAAGVGERGLDLQ